MFVRLLHFLRQWLGVRTFLLSPYQLGRGNNEAVGSGAFWFYAKLGFRPVRPGLCRLASSERRRLAKDSAYRSSPETLRRLSEGRMWLGIDGPGAPAVRDFDVGRLLHRTPGSATAWALVRALQATGWHAWPAAERAALRRLAPILTRIPDLARWSTRDRRALVEIIRAKGGPEERVYLRHMQRHRRLREAVLRLGGPG